MRIAAAAWLLLLAGAAAAQERFGSKGAVSPSGSIGVSYTSRSTENFGDSNSYGFSLQPGAMFFVADDIAIGGTLRFSYTSFRQSGASDRLNSTGYGIGPAVGWNLWLGERISLFPQATLSASWTRLALSGSSSTGRVITVEGFVPALLHVTSHFFVGLGPTISADIDSTVNLITSTGTTGTVSSNATTFALQSVIGGWF